MGEAGTKYSGVEVGELLSAAGMALGRRAWDEAQECCERALAIEESAEALEGLAVGSWWRDDADAATEARERATTPGSSATSPRS